MVFLILSAKGEEESESLERMTSLWQGKQPYIDQGAVRQAPASMAFLVARRSQAIKLSGCRLALWRR